MRKQKPWHLLSPATKRRRDRQRWIIEEIADLKLLDYLFNKLPMAEKRTKDKKLVLAEIMRRSHEVRQVLGRRPKL